MEDNNTIVIVVVFITLVLTIVFAITFAVAFPGVFTSLFALLSALFFIALVFTVAFTLTFAVLLSILRLLHQYHRNHPLGFHLDAVRYLNERGLLCCLLCHSGTQAVRLHCLKRPSLFKLNYRFQVLPNGWHLCL
ncbi:hypothetical protein Forpe1208_v011113 [Fusarium oxysporum f. sp. rapae]|uniref:Uncharacterized protein n=1 Tax=Fusarium oxysporum f. sp. rapae TaxID=485398 RepID=A0A8J5P0C9_FUSOX|nr:hypothetical protein Forpe1208_v011113 [Fusarium oxysporum f. sp. rapae]